MSKENKRHLFLTIWLSLLVISNLLLGLSYLIRTESIHQLVPTAPLWVIKIEGGFMLFNFICAVALFQYKKWGFWGFCITAVIACFLNVFYCGVSLLVAVMSGIFSILLLYFALNVGQERKAWTKLT